MTQINDRRRYQRFCCLCYLCLFKINERHGCIEGYLSEYVTSFSCHSRVRLALYPTETWCKRTCRVQNTVLPLYSISVQREMVVESKVGKLMILRALGRISQFSLLKLFKRWLGKWQSSPESLLCTLQRDTY